MSQASLFKSLYCQNSFSNATPIKKLLKAYLDNASIDGHLVESAFGFDLSPSTATPFSVLEKWREFLSAVLVLQQTAILSTYQTVAQNKMRQLSLLNLWPEFQMLSLYHSLVAVLLGQGAQDVAVVQLPSGACPVDGSGMWLWGEVPHPVLHAEFGVLLCLYGSVTGHSAYLDTALKLAEWQKNTLDYSYNAFSGLLSREGDASEHALMVNNCLLYDTVAKCTGRHEIAFLAGKIYQQLSKLSGYGAKVTIAPHALLLAEAFKDKESPASNAESHLQSSSEDANLAMVGCRSPGGSVVATLFGGGSGMGCLHSGDIQVVSYGPQHMPLGDCRGYGIEGSARLLTREVKRLSASDGQFILEGVSRMAPAGVYDRFSGACPSGIWLESCQSYNRGVLDVDVTLQELIDTESLAFSFFVKCQTCLVDGIRTVKPRSLNRYSGPGASILFQGIEKSVELCAEQPHQEMHVIPLGGGDIFWGADFLVAYLLPANQKRYSWKLRIA